MEKLEYIVDEKDVKRLQSFGKSKLEWIRPIEFLNKSPIVFIDEQSFKDLKQKIQKGTKMDPLWIDVDCKGIPIRHEGRHRALAALCLGIEKVPVLIFDKCYLKN